MKITRDKALEITALCRKHGFKYVGAGSYGNPARAGLKAGTKAPNGVRIHFPRDQVDTYNKALVENPRVYVLWFGEPKEAIEEACAYLLMITRDKEIYVVRCNENISKAAEEIESCSSES